MLEKRLQEIKDEKLEIRNKLESNEEVNLDEVKTKLEALELEERSINEKLSISQNLQNLEVRKVEKTMENNKVEERKFEVMTKDERIATPEYRSAFLKSLRGEKLNDIETRAMVTDPTGAGASAGNAVPTTTLDLIIRKLYQTSVLLPKIKVTYVPGNLSVTVQSSLQSADWHQEGTSANGKDESIVKVTFAGFELIRLIQISKAALLMTIDAFENFIVDEIVKRMAVAIENGILNGTGSANTQPSGLLDSSVGAFDGTNSVTFTKAGAKYSDFLKIFSTLPTMYHQNACVVVNRKLMFSDIAGCVDNYGRPIFQLDPTAPINYRILGYPAILDDYVPDDTLIFGDLSYYQMNFQQGIMVEKSLESSFAKNLVDYKATSILDGKVLLKEAFVKATRSAT